MPHNFVWISGHNTSVMIMVGNMVALAMLGLCFGNVYFSQYMLVVLLHERSNE